MNRQELETHLGCSDSTIRRLLEALKIDVNKEHFSDEEVDLLKRARELMASKKVKKYDYLYDYLLGDKAGQEPAKESQEETKKKTNEGEGYRKFINDFADNLIDNALDHVIEYLPEIVDRKLNEKKRQLQMGESFHRMNTRYIQPVYEEPEPSEWDDGNTINVEARSVEQPPAY